MLMRCWDPPRAQHLTHRPLLCPPPAEFVRRKKTALWFVGALLAVSASILTVGLAATTRTEDVTVGGYYPGIIVSVGSLGAGLGAQDRQFRVVLRHIAPAPQRWKFRWLATSSGGPMGCRVLRSGEGKESEPRSVIGPPQGPQREPTLSEIGLGL